MKVTQSCPTLQPHGLYSPWYSPGQNTGVGSLSLLKGIFPMQGSNPGLPHCRQILYQLSHKGSPRILEWVAYPFSRRSSQPRNWTGVFCIAGRFFTNWAIREVSWVSSTQLPHTHAFSASADTSLTQQTWLIQQAVDSLWEVSLPAVAGATLTHPDSPTPRSRAAHEVLYLLKSQKC